jgi:CRP-like cAMP-binding protein
MLRNDVLSSSAEHGFEAEYFRPDYHQRRTIEKKASDALRTPNWLLTGLPPVTKAALTPHLRRIDVVREQFLFQQDDRLEYVYFPESAVVSEMHLLDDGRMVEVAMCGRNGAVAVGIASLYDAQHISNCVQVTQAGTLLRIESSLLKKQAAVHPTLPLQLYMSLENYIRQISQRAVCNMYHSIEERLCTWLLLVQELSGRKVLKLTHEQISRALGVYRPSITCIALELRNSGMIDYKRGGMSLVEREQLIGAACDCYRELRPAFSKPTRYEQAVPA